MRKRLVALGAALICAFSLAAQEKPNDYSMIGVYGGASAQYGFFNPSRLTKFQFSYPAFGISYVRYFTMFGMFPNMGLELGGQLNYEGYEFKMNDETKRRSTESGAYKMVMRVPEIYGLSHFHVDMADRVKLMAKVGLYAGYRMDITRTLEEGYGAYSDYVNSFRDYDRRWTYGLQGGIGAAYMLDPFEIHLNVQIKWGWSSFWEPDSAPKYYFRFAYPLDGLVSLGIYYQLTPRHGKSRSQLRKEAKEIVRSEYENFERTDR